MIATCPACGKRYRLANAAVPAAGRAVRCSACTHGWIVVPEPLHSEPQLPLPPPAAPVVAPVADPVAAFEPFAEAAPRRRRWPWLIVVLAVAAVAVAYLAPQLSNSVPARLGLPPLALPAVTVPAFDLPRLALPPLPPLPRLTISVPPLDLTRIPYVGDTLDRWLDPPPVPPSPLRLTLAAERRRLTNGTRLLVVHGTVTNPTATALPVPAIAATLADAAGTVRLRWRIAAPVATLAPGGTAAFDSIAANYPGDAPALALAFAAR